VRHWAVVSRPWRIAGYAGLGLALAVGTLVAAAAVFEPRTREQVASRIAESLAARAAIAQGDLALVRGRLDLRGLTARREDAAGTLAVDVAALRCELPPLGLALIDRDCRTLALSGTRVAVSSLAVFQIRTPRRSPLVAGRVVIEDAQLALAPSELGRIALTIAHAEAGATIFRTPLSWLFALRELEAAIELPPGITFAVSYRAGMLRVSGALLGATSVAVPVALPIVDPAEGPGGEVARLAAFGKDVAARLFERRAADWLESTLGR